MLAIYAIYSARRCSPLVAPINVVILPGERIYTCEFRYIGKAMWTKSVSSRVLPSAVEMRWNLRPQNKKNHDENGRHIQNDI